MAKKSKKSRLKTEIESKPIRVDDSKPAPSNTSDPEKEETGFDFGGLPKRDLKKNLGCG